jgi:hypothetical protein
MRVTQVQRQSRVSGAATVQSKVIMIGDELRCL